MRISSAPGPTGYTVDLSRFTAQGRYDPAKIYSEHVIETRPHNEEESYASEDFFKWTIVGDTMRSQEIIDALTSDPCDANVAKAKDWLAKRKKSGRRTNEVVEALTVSGGDYEILAWLQGWIRDKDWSPLLRLASSNRISYVPDLLLMLATANPSHPQAGETWAALLINYKAKEITQGAKHWLLNNFSEDHINATVAAKLLDQHYDAELKNKASHLLERVPEHLELVISVIRRFGNDHAVRLGLAKMHTEDPALGSLIAKSLLEADSEKYWPVVREWLRQPIVWNYQYVRNVLSDLCAVAPQVMAPLIFDWFDDHDNVRFRNATLIFRDMVMLERSQVFVDLAWAWLTERRNHKLFPELLGALLAGWETEKLPEELLAYAETSLFNNKTGPILTSLLLGLLKQGLNEVRLALARKKLDQSPDSDKGYLLMNFIRYTTGQFEPQAVDWAKNHPNDPASGAILVQMLRNNPQTFAQEAKDLKDSQMPIYHDKLNLELAKVGDKESLEIAKKKIAVPHRIERKWSEPARCRAAPWLVALLKGAPNDQSSIEFAREWLASDGEVCNEHLQKVREAYDAALSSSKK